MNGFIIVNGLMVVFGLAMLVGALWAVLRLRQKAPMMMRRRLDREIALRLDVMNAISLAYPDAESAQRERLALNYRFNRAAVLALDPGAATAAMDARFAPTAVPQQRAA